MRFDFIGSARLWLALICLASLLVVPTTPLGLPALIKARGVSATDGVEPPDLEKYEGYLEPAPGGMDVRYAWGVEGGRGENVRIVDIEVDWNLAHNDLKHATSNLFVYEKGVDPRPEDNIDHGTAVLGEIVAADDGIGVTGIANRASLGLLNPVASNGALNVAEAINRAARLLDPGDVILVEQQLIGPRFDFRTGHGMVPAEFDPQVFDAIKSATSRGIMVVEPAANGFEDLDHPAYNGVFDRNKRDSGAIVVGAGMPPAGLYGPGPDRARFEESNYGSRVDLQGWARSVTTCGYGDLRRDQGKNNWYTINFGGTSGAAAMVAGAAAVIQGIVKARRGTALSPLQLRQFLVSTGSPQTGDLDQHIGPRPDLRAAIALLDSLQQQPAPEITSVAYNEAKGRLIVNGKHFIPGDSVIEIDGSRVARAKYPIGFWLEDGTTTRILSKGDISALLPQGVDVAVTVLTLSTGKRSEPFTFRRE